jgi:hypothetical protein
MHLGWNTVFFATNFEQTTSKHAVVPRALRGFSTIACGADAAGTLRC